VKLPVKRFLTIEHEYTFVVEAEFVGESENVSTTGGGLVSGALVITGAGGMAFVSGGATTMGAAGGGLVSGLLVSTGAFVETDTTATFVGAGAGGTTFVAGIFVGVIGAGATATGGGAGLGGGVLVGLIQTPSKAITPTTKMAMPNLFFIRSIRILRHLISTERLYFLHNRSGVNAKFRKQFLRLAGMRHSDHGQFVDFDSVPAQFAGDRVAKATLGIMILDGDDSVFCLLRGGENFLFAKRLYAVSVNDGDVDAFAFQGIRGFQRFKQRDARRDNCDLVARAQNFSAANGELVVVAVNYRRLGTRCAEKLTPFAQSHLLKQLFRGDGVGRIQNSAADNCAHHG